MTIQIISWYSPKLLEGTGYTHGQEIDGTDAEALGIAMELFMNGLNIRVTRHGPPNYPDKTITIAVDDKGFTQR
jgi:hypothetical protein